MTPRDFDFAVRITDQMNWDMSAEDFKFMTELEPEGCFILFSGSKRIGLATTVSYGKIGWFGNLIVEKSLRNKGAGSLLVEHSIEYLESKSVQTIGLYSYIDRIPFYERLGFVRDSDFTVLKGIASSILANRNFRIAQEEDLDAIADLDFSCFGGDRRRLLKPIIADLNNLCYLSTDEDELQGCLVAKVFDGTAELGPLLCRQGRIETAASLLKATLSKLESYEVSFCISKKESTNIRMLEKYGFHEDFPLTRMFHGPPVTTKCIYGAESLERG